MIRNVYACFSIIITCRVRVKLEAHEKFGSNFRLGDDFPKVSRYPLLPTKGELSLGLKRSGNDDKHITNFVTLHILVSPISQMYVCMYFIDYSIRYKGKSNIKDDYHNSMIPMN